MQKLKRRSVEILPECQAIAAPAAAAAAAVPALVRLSFSLQHLR